MSWFSDTEFITSAISTAWGNKNHKNMSANISHVEAKKLDFKRSENKYISRIFKIIFTTSYFHTSGQHPSCAVEGIYVNMHFIKLKLKFKLRFYGLENNLSGFYEYTLVHWFQIYLAFSLTMCKGIQFPCILIKKL